MKITPNSVLVLLSVLASAHAFTVPQKSHPSVSQPKLARPTCLPKVNTAPKHGDSTSLSMIEFSSELVGESGVNLYNALLPLAIFASSITLSVKNSSPRVEMDWTATRRADAVAFAQPLEETPVTVAPDAMATPKLEGIAAKAKPSVVIQTFRFFSRGFTFPFRGLKKLFSRKGIAA